MRNWSWILIPLFPFATAQAGDWPQWLGPDRNGATTEVVKPWTGDPKELWRVPVGEGHSSPVVANGIVYLHAKVAEKDMERLTAFAAADGKLVGQIEYERGPFQSQFGAGPRATPLVLGGMVYTLGVTGWLRGQVLEAVPTGGSRVETRFSIDTLKQFKANNLRFGISASPLVEGDLVIAAVGGKGASVVAFDKKNGSVVWKSLDDAASYAAPIAIGPGENRQIVVLTAKGLVSLAPKDGRLLWQFPFRDLLSESSTTPVQVGGLLIASSVTLGSVALRLTEKDGKPAVEQMWKKPELSCYFSTPVPDGKDHLYMVTGSILPKPAIKLRCVETATGKTLWTKSDIGQYHAALLRTGDDKLLMLDDSGRLTLIEPNAAEYKELARSKICGETWAHPAYANGRLYVRDNKDLICLALGD